MEKLDQLFWEEIIMMFRERIHLTEKRLIFTTEAVLQQIWRFNVIGDSFRGATWVSIHNGGGVGWGEVINGGFGMLLDGTEDADRRLKSMLFWDVNNGISRRSWARNEGAIFAIKRAMEAEPNLKVTLPNFVDEGLLLNNLEKYK